MSSKKKLFAIIAAVAMLAGMLAFGAVPSLATSSSVTAVSCPNIAVTAESTGGALGAIQITDIPITNTSTDTVKISLPGGVDFGSVTVSAATYLPGTTTPNALSSTFGGTVSAPTVNSGTITFTMGTTSTAYTTGAVTITLPYTSMSGLATGAVNAIVQDTLALIGSQSVQVGTIVSTGTVATCQSTVSLAPSSTSTGDVTVNLSENTPNALEGNNGYLNVKLPSHFTWASVKVTVSGGWDPTLLGSGSSAPTTAGAVYYSVNGREVDFYFGPSDTAVGMLTLTGTITADYDAPAGDIVANVGGTNSGVTDQSLTVGTCGNYGVTVTNGTGDVITGEGGCGLPDFSINESAAGSLIANRSISLTLPSGVYWDAIDSTPTAQSTNGGTVTMGDWSVSSDGTTLTGTVLTQSSGTPADIQFSNLDVNVDTTAALGPLNIKVSGNGIDTTVQAATIIAPVTISGTASPLPSVVIGQQSQAASDFTITETATANLMTGTLAIFAPTGVSFSGTPTATLTAGDMTIGTAVVTGYNGGLANEIEIPINNESSSTAGVIAVSGISLNVDNSVPTGPISLDLGGTALVCAQGTTLQAENLGVQQYANQGITGDYVVTIPVATVTTAVTTTGSQTGTSGSAEFTVGATVYSVNGVQYVMDVAPYISNSRTFVPVRYLGYALNASVAWDAATQTVTLTKGSDTVVLTIGSTTETVNGTAQTMDVAPVIVNSRTMLPARWVAEALGAQVGWNPMNQVVTIIY